MLGALAVAVCGRSLARILSRDEWPGAAAAAFVTTALLSGLVVDRALDRPREAGGRALCSAIGAAIANVTLWLWTCGLGLVVIEWVRSPPERPVQIFGPLVFGAALGILAALPGLVVSLPLGVVFGITYAIVVARAARALETPTHASLLHVRTTGAVFLVASALGAVALSALLVEGWRVRLGIAAAPLSLALVSALVSWRERAALRSLEATLRADHHPTLTLLPRALARESPEALLLRPGAEDARFAVVSRDNSSAYRSRPVALAYLA